MKELNPWSSKFSLPVTLQVSFSFGIILDVLVTQLSYISKMTHVWAKWLLAKQLVSKATSHTGIHNTTHTHTLQTLLQHWRICLVDILTDPAADCEAEGKWVGRVMVVEERGTGRMGKGRIGKGRTGKGRIGKWRTEKGGTGKEGEFLKTVYQEQCMYYSSGTAVAVDLI